MMPFCTESYLEKERRHVNYAGSFTHTHTHPTGTQSVFPRKTFELLKVCAYVNKKQSYFLGLDITVSELKNWLQIPQFIAKLQIPPAYAKLLIALILTAPENEQPLLLCSVKPRKQKKPL